MTTNLKQFFLTGFIFLLTAASLHAQIAVLQYRSVPQEHINEFLYRETTYWSEVAKKAIADEKLVSWELWQRVGGFDLDEDSYNFVFVNVFKDKTALDNMSGIWNPSKVFPNTRIADMETNSLSQVVHLVMVQNQGNVGMGGNFVVVNYAKVRDMENYLAFETGTWKPLIDKLIKEKKTSFVGWNVATVLSPGGSSAPFNAFSADHFETMGDAILPSWDEDIEFPDFTEYAKTNDRVKVETYGLVKRVN